MKLAQKCQQILSFDILAHIVSGYRKIPVLFKTTFWTLFVVLNIVYAYHTAHFIMGNHEWPFMREAISWNRFWYEGRITETLPYALFGFQLLPIALNLFCFIGISLSAVFLARFLKIPYNKFCLIGFCLPVAVLPYHLCYLFHNAQGVFYYGVFLIIAAFTWIEHIYQKKQLFLSYIFPVFILFFVLGFHAAFIETMSILIVAHVLIRFLLGEQFKPLFKVAFVLFLNVAISAICLRLSVDILDNMGYLSSDFYNVQTVQFDQLYSHFIDVCCYAMEQFRITYPFLDAPYLSFLWGICIFSSLFIVYNAYKKHSMMGVFVGLLGIVGLVFLTQLATLISDNKQQIQFWLRLNGYFGVQYLVIFFFAFLFQFYHRVFLKNLLFLLVVVLSAFSIQRDMYAMRVWKQGLDAENKQMDHVIARIENSPHFSYDKKYKIAQIGDFSLRKRYYEGEYNGEDSTLLGWSFRAFWLNHIFYNFNAPRNFITQNLTNQWDSIFQNCSKEDFDFIMNKAKVWPDQNSVYISRDLILIFVENSELQDLRNQLKSYLEKNNLQINQNLKGVPFNEALKHPAWGPDILTRIDDDRLYHARFNNYATILEYTNSRILLDWDCCGQELFVKNAEGIYEYKE